MLQTGRQVQMAIAPPPHQKVLKAGQQGADTRKCNTLLPKRSTIPTEARSVLTSAAAKEGPQAVGETPVGVTPGAGIFGGAWPSYPPYTPATTEQRLFAKLHAYQEPACLQAAFGLGIHDLLAGGPMTPAQLAVATGADAHKVRRLLRFLVGRGLFERVEDAADGQPQFANNDLTNHLQKEVSPQCWGTAVREGQYMACLGSFQKSLSESSKKTMWEVEHGKNVFAHFMGGGPTLASAFPLSFDLMSPPRLALLDCLDDSLASAPGAHIVDVGGNIGTLLAGMLKLRPRAKGTIYEQPGLVEKAAGFLKAQGLEDRTEVVGGDFFTGENLPEGAEMYFMAYIIHDWGDEESTTILKNLGSVMHAHSKVIVMDFVLEEDDVMAAGPAVNMDMSMLTSTSGYERTHAEFAALAAGAGLQVDKIDTPAPGQPSLIYISKP